ncbi:S10 family peptidase [Bradyrhizobium guangzhouense]|uniref:Peptidase S1 n=1 Tax=Bradyrhizobium guangzhouense TaxID=1325095 RepID=A0ABY0E775_9BRAD|nr:peptidase S1 [Bradyrhizobium guangzhouense]RXH11835.1 peptidase S1 [Bradyrhizobium guangzhouense]RXH18315.1 peptidase S1 [Bradyrhizobium guangzhouense]
MSVMPFEEQPSDPPLLDTVIYGARKEDSITDTTEASVATQHELTVGGVTLEYTARAGHLVTVDLYSGQPAAKLFYVAFTANVPNQKERPVTFFYNGGPGSSSVYLLLGSFGPRRIRTSMPDFTPPAPYALEDNQDTLLDHSDLVFINPVGTGYSAAIAPNKNKDFWGVDQDAGCIKQFIKRYLTVFQRWNSPKFLFGESYGTPRTCVLTWMLHEDGVDLNGVVLQSSILDYSKASNPIGTLPTLAADAHYWKKVATKPPPKDLPSFMESVEAFARGPYAKALSEYPKIKPELLETLSEILGIPPATLRHWKLNPAADDATPFLTSLRRDEGYAIGSYDGRNYADEEGIAGAISPDSGNNDPTITAIGGVYTTMWNVYLNEELKYTSVSPFLDSNDEAFKNWDFRHIDPTGAHKGGPDSLYTAGDLAAAMSLNPNLKVFSANGYYDAVTPFFQTKLNFEQMPLKGPHTAERIEIRNYGSGHMVYLDNESRAAMKADLANFYQPPPPTAAAAARSVQQAGKIHSTRVRRRMSRTPY